MSVGEWVAIAGGLLFLALCGFLAFVLIIAAIRRRKTPTVAEVYRLPKDADKSAHVTLADLVDGEVDRERSRRRRQKTIDKLVEMFDAPNA